MPRMLRQSSHSIAPGGGRMGGEYLVSVKPLKMPLNKAMKPKSKNKKKETAPYRRVQNKQHPDVSTKNRPQAPR